MVFFYYSLAICTITVFLNFHLLIGFKKIKQLSKQPLIEEPPSLAIIIAVSNEEDDLEKALQSICNINYQNCRVIVINDRSTDRTAEILVNFKLGYPQLNILTINTLPDGWLGKNNALYQGYRNSTEEWLLFTDADIVFHPDAINRALGYAVNNQLDHMTILPDLVSGSALLNSVFATLCIMLMIDMKPWDAKNPKSKSSSGIGAFNLVRRSAYEKIGTHAKIRLRPDDDLQLGMKIKLANLKQDVLAGKGYVCLEWYKSFRQLANGVLKNSFAIADYKLTTAIANVLFILIAIALPMPVMFIFGTTTIRLMAAIMLFCHITYMIIVPPNKWWYALMIPFSGFFIAWIFLRATAITIVRGGIYWRESFYSLKMLKEEN
ncbi:glycosyltransferase family 2 protein [Mucilaginibacter sp. BJC16-A38]|uniref:glycosyltransferase n=1 Tax=Mucilaginibacter phenanthrenivorans TaxID=1234842 RepID=UPI002157A88D|nr:glycosyltransferase family 2 protein [Mucilaginibacter phenanthrenivorans]MCR8556804.1 glycosyltransferase family 2 protein [Mucilaginibacter phenanthrenivorans]